jgi:hypothetical protein
MNTNYKIYLLFCLALLVGCKDKPNIIITSEPPGASVLDDSNDKVLGTTPYEEFRKDSGSYQYLLRLKHYKDVKVSVELKDVTSVQSKEIQLIDMRNVNIVTEPTGASITGLGVDGETTPYSGVLKPGKYELTLTKEGFFPEKVSLKIIKEGDRVEKMVRLLSIRNVSINSEPTGATLSGNGFMGKTTPFLEEVKPGKYEVTVTKEGFHEEKLSFSMGTPKDQFEKKIKLMTTQEYETKKLECDKQNLIVVEGECKVDWSPDMGSLDWDSANAKCRSIGMRLPSFDELKAAYNAGITKSWPGFGYWSSTPYDAERYYSLYVGDGGTDNYNRSDYAYVRCRR